MTPRNTKHGASANRRTTGSRGSRAAASSRSPKKATRRQTADRSNQRASGRPRKPQGSGRKVAPRRQPLPRWWIVPAGIALTVLLFGWMYYPVMRVQYREAREKARLAAELEAIQARNERLREQVDRLKTPAGVEDYARSQLGMVKKGENVVVVVDEDNPAEKNRVDAAPVIDSADTTASPAGPWTAFLDLVFGVQ